jgi:hypothetical protein
MISYEAYKTIHLILILIFFSSMGFAINETSIFQKPKGKILLGLVSFLIFVAGMGLVARLNMKHTEAFPQWVRFKVGLWILINILVLLMIKIKKINIRLILASLILFAGAIAIIMAVNKPI